MSPPVTCPCCMQIWNGDWASSTLTQILPSSNVTPSSIFSMVSEWSCCIQRSHSPICSKLLGPCAHQLRSARWWLPPLPMVMSCWWPACASHRMLTASCANSRIRGSVGLLCSRCIQRLRSMLRRRCGSRTASFHFHAF